MKYLKRNIAAVAVILLAVIVLTGAELASKTSHTYTFIRETPQNTLPEAKNSPVATSTPQVATKPKPSPKPVSVATPAPDKAKLEAYLTRVGGNPALAQDYIDQAAANGIDWRLLPAIGQQESTSGAHYPKSTNNLWGYGCAKGIPCYISSNGSNLEIFQSITDGISTVSYALGHAAYYAGKDTYHKLARYNGNPGYPERIISIMQSIAK